jgi:hypothetical protein
MTPSLLISSYPKFLRNLLLWTRKMERRVFIKCHSVVPRNLNVRVTVVFHSFDIGGRTFACSVWSILRPICKPTESRDNGYVCFFLSPVHSIRSFFLCLSAVRSLQSQPVQGEQSGYIRLPCEAQTVWCLLHCELPLRFTSPSTVRSSMPTYSSLWRLWSVNVVNG